MSGAHWFAIWTRSRHEQVVREQLAHERLCIGVHAHERTLDLVLQLAHVAGPGVADQEIHHVGGHLRNGLAHLACKTADERAHELGNVLAPPTAGVAESSQDDD